VCGGFVDHRRISRCKAYYLRVPILGDATVVAAKVSRSLANALRVQLTTPDGVELAHAQQKGGLGVLLGFKNGGKATYTFSAASDEALQIDVGGTTTITNPDRIVGKIVPADGAARFENAAGAVLAVVRPHVGFKADNAWHHPIFTPAGQELGVLTLMRVRTSWADIEEDIYQQLLHYSYARSLKAPSAGVLLKLSAPVGPELGDVLAAACVDFSVLPRGYIA
jgi:hypothetical protein